MQYPLIHFPHSLHPDLGWDDEPWATIPTLSIAHFHPRSGKHRPETYAKLLLAGDTLYVLFRVIDRYVKSECTRYQEPVSDDSCVELFLQPAGSSAYFNFEFNCGGVMLLYLIRDPGTLATGLKAFDPVDREHAEQIAIVSTLPRINRTEIAGPIEWRLLTSIPLAVLRSYVGLLPVEYGAIWRANLFKCGDKTRHPHWAAWSDIGDELRFHQPSRFGQFVLTAANSRRIVDKAAARQAM